MAMRRMRWLVLVILALCLLGGCAGVRQQATTLRDQLDRMDQELQALNEAVARNTSEIRALRDRLPSSEAGEDVSTDTAEEAED